MHCSDLPDARAALPVSIPLVSMSINCAGKRTSHVNASGALAGSEIAEIVKVTRSPGAFVTDET